MYISPYIEQAFERPSSKIFSTPEDIIHDTKLSSIEKNILLRKMDAFYAPGRGMYQRGMS